MTWFKSSRSSDSFNCVEVAIAEAEILVRDSKDRDGAILRYAPETWRAFIAAIQAGEFGEVHPSA